MKKIIILIIAVVLVFSFMACDKATAAAAEETISDLSTNGIENDQTADTDDESVELSPEETAEDEGIEALFPFPDSKTNLWGYINQEGEFLIEPKFRATTEFDENNQAAVLTDNDLIYIDREGNQVAYRNVLEFAENGLAAYLDESGLWGYVNKEEELVIKIQFQTAHTFAKNGIALVFNGFGYGWIDSSGEYVIDPDYSWGTDFADNGLAGAQEGDELCGYISENGEYVIEPKFKTVLDFQENGLASVQNINRLYGFIDESGEYVIEPRFIDETPNGSRIVPYFEENGLACVRENINGLYGFIDESGEYVIEPKYYWYSKFDKNGFAVVREEENGLVGFINQEGEYFIELQFKESAGFNNSRIALVQDQNGLWGYINEKGEYIIGPK